MAAALAMLVVLSERGWGAQAWSVAAGLLLVSCLAVCIWAAVLAGRASREVDRAVARLAAAGTIARCGPAGVPARGGPTRRRHDPADVPRSAPDGPMQRYQVVDPQLRHSANGAFIDALEAHQRDVDRMLAASP